MTTGSAVPATLAELQQPLRQRLDLVKEELRRIVADDFQFIGEVNAHLLRMQGKLFRPTLLLLADEAVSEPARGAVSLAAVIELIHLATLVHDDSVDHSVLRRGMPTLNSLFSHQVSVIMGDYLYSRAIIELVRHEDMDALRVISRVTNEMTVGEMRQLLSHDRLGFDEAAYDLLIRSKTASLMSGACEVGALAAPPAERRALARFGNALGMAFQIVDDLLDYTEDEAVTGKPTGLDLREHKVTLPLIASLPHMDEPGRQAVTTLMRTESPPPPQVQEVIGLVAEAGGLEYARARAVDWAQRAETELEHLPATPARERLRACVTYVLERRS